MNWSLSSPTPAFAWTLVVASGLCEIVFSVLLKAADGFTKPGPTAAAVGFGLVSIWLMSVALRGVALGPAYAVWAGIGTLGTAVMATWLYGEALTPLKALFFALVVVGIVGLQWSESA